MTQVVASCGYLTDVIIISLFDVLSETIASGSTPERGLKMPTSENGGATVQGAGCGVE